MCTRSINICMASPDMDILADETAAWEEPRNEAEVTARWRFTTEDARIKLHKLYPSIQA